MIVDRSAKRWSFILLLSNSGGLRPWLGNEMLVPNRALAQA
jgi:hypothetical protein